MSNVDDFLQHYGVKGMKWGQRKSESGGGIKSKIQKFNEERNAPKAVTARQKPGQFVKTSGGGKQKAHDDAVRAQFSRQKAKASTTDSLSNQELQQLVTRMNLEVQYQNLSSQVDRRSSGQKMVNTLLGQEKFRDTVISNTAERRGGSHIPGLIDTAVKLTAGPMAGKKKK